MHQQITESGGCSLNNDRISNLHESILSHILSRLPTKDAAKTSILSKHWKDKWIYMYHVDLRDLSTGSENFAKFLDKIFTHAFNLKSVRLSCNGYFRLGRVESWIFEIFKHQNIESLEVICKRSFKSRGLLLPWSFIMDRPSLKDLHLFIPGCCLFISVDNSFANLKSFHLEEIQLSNNFPNKGTLMLNFPALEILTVTECRWLNVELVKIYAPLLHTFISKTGPSEETQPLETSLKRYSIEIIGSSLSIFQHSGGLPDNIILTGSQPHTVHFSTVNYNVDLLDQHSILKDVGLLVSKVLNGSSRLNELNLSYYYVKALLFERAPDLRKHKELIRLEVSGATETVGLLKLLHVAPSLKFFSVNVYALDVYDYGAIELVPPCIKSYMEEVKLLSFNGTAHQYNIAKFLLENGSVLKKLSIKSSLHQPPECNFMLEMLSRFPRISTKLTIDACS